MISPRDLTALGLSKNTAAIYLALQQRGQAKAAALIADTALHRNIVYLALTELERAKLISKTHARGVAIFKALDPSNLLNHIRTQELAAQAVIEELRHLRKPQTQEIIVYEGLDELRRKELESYALIPEGGSMYYIGVSPHWHKAIGSKLQKQLLDLQRERMIHIRAIAAHETPEQREFLSTNLTEIRIDPAISSEVSETQVLHDRIMIKTFVEPYSIVEIINPLVAKSYRDFFDTLWKKVQ